MRSFLSITVLLAVSVTAAQYEKVKLAARQFQPLDDVIHKTPVDNEFGSFLYPREYPLRFEANSTYAIKWESKFPACDLLFYKKGMPGGFAVTLAKNVTDGIVYWKPEELPWDGVGPFTFRVYDSSVRPIKPNSNSSFISASWYYTYDGRELKVSELNDTTSTISSSASSTPAPSASSKRPKSKHSNSTMSSSKSESISSTPVTTVSTPTITPPTFLTDIPSIPPVDPVETGTPGSGASAVASIGWSINLVLAGILYMLL